MEEADVLMKEEEEAREINQANENKRREEAAKRRKQTRKAKSREEREEKARDLDRLLKQSAAFSDILTKKTQVLGRVGSGLDGKALGEHELTMAKQPSIMSGGKMRDYQLEGLTWMFEICQQGMSGILADEMGLGELQKSRPCSYCIQLTSVQARLYKLSL
jgi:ATP-dependent DNA helicase